MTTPADKSAAIVAVNGTALGTFFTTVAREQENEIIRLAPGTQVIDRIWTYTDTSGHDHHGDNLGATLLDVRVACFCPAVNEPHDVHDHWECRQCGEVTRPGTTPARPMVVPTMVRTTIHLEGSAPGAVRNSLLQWDTACNIEIQWFEGKRMSGKALLMDASDSGGYRPSSSFDFEVVGDYTVTYPTSDREARN